MDTLCSILLILSELLKRNGSVSIHHRNIQQLAIEIFKALHGYSTVLMSELFTVTVSKYNMRNKSKLVPIAPHSTKYGLNSISHLAPKIWDILPGQIKSSTSLNMFKERVKVWTPEECPCSLCRPYVQHIGFT